MSKPVIKGDAYNGLRFFIEINEPEVKGGSVTINVVHGTHCARTNKRRLRAFLTKWGVKPCFHKSVLKELGFWGDALGS